MENRLEKIIDKSFDSIVRLSPLPDLAEETIILGKNVITNKEVKENIKQIFENIMNNKKIDIGENITDLIDVAISEIVKNKNLNKDIVDILKNNKDFILENIRNKDEYKLQEKYIEELDNSYKKWEEYFKKGDIENMNRCYEKIINSLDNVKKTEDILEKSYGVKEMHELMKNKIKEGSYEITDIEKELCRKIG